MVGSASSPPSPHTWYLSGHQNPTTSFVRKRESPPAQSVDSPARDGLHIRHATNSWLSPEKVNVELGPDCDHSPHPVRRLPVDLGTTPYFELLFGPEKADQGHASQAAKQEESQAQDEALPQNKVLPSFEEVLVTFRLQVDSCGPSELSALIKILLGGTPVSCSNRQLWIQAVQDSFDDAPQTASACLGSSSSSGVQSVFG